MILLVFREFKGDVQDSAGQLVDADLWLYDSSPGPVCFDRIQVTRLRRHRVDAFSGSRRVEQTAAVRLPVLWPIRAVRTAMGELRVKLVS